MSTAVRAQHENLFKAAVAAGAWAPGRSRRASYGGVVHVLLRSLLAIITFSRRRLLLVPGLALLAAWAGGTLGAQQVTLPLSRYEELRARANPEAPEGPAPPAP
ncbi:MAG TPA: hypothetical protein VMM92_00615, partial [Thermoanaerobaculia bacterium]|nr:hypothetical protein [Thermoanaerobaculia bacterium]